jgi:L-seryl-tRNA(Ser) seleniumtransferase
MSQYGLPKEPVVSERIKAGADIVTFSGDKLLGGPQAGIIVGRSVFVDRIRKNPLKRALRAGKLTLSALEATLRLYLKPEELKDRLPTLRYLSRDIQEIDAVAMEGAELLKTALGSEYAVEVIDGESQIGSGSQPMARLKSRVISITRKGRDASLIFTAFLAAKPAILGRVKDDKFLLDMRTIDKASDIVPSGFVKQ